MERRPRESGAATSHRSTSMLAVAARHWWVLAIQGILGIAFGVLALLFPGIALITLAYVFAAWALITGVSHLAEGFRVAEHRGRSWPFAVMGVLAIVAGILAALIPGLTIVGLVTLLGAWLVVQGVMEIYTAWRIREEVTGEWVLALIGILRVVLGLIILALPVVGLILTASFVGVGAIFAGAAALSLSWRLRKLAATGGRPTGQMRGATSA
jgi:uncharacterized membrane protein HdeD (DUF308 family)